MPDCTCFNPDGTPRGGAYRECPQHPTHIRVELIRAGQPDPHGRVFAREALQLLHDGKRLFYDVIAGVLWWFGPRHECHHPITPVAHITVPTAVHVRVRTHCWYCNEPRECDADCPCGAPAEMPEGF